MIEQALRALTTKDGTYLGVGKRANAAKPYKADIPRAALVEGQSAYAGVHATAEEAALAIVKKIGFQATLQLSSLAAKKQQMPVLDEDTNAELTRIAKAQAHEEGLTLVTASNQSGYKSVQKRVLKRPGHSSSGKTWSTRKNP